MSSVYSSKPASAPGAPLNGDMARRALVHAALADWEPSPSGSVWRKRLHRVGPAESGQVTAIVRYEPDAAFPAHDHPDGEEILVLDGVFSDDQGDWPAGTYLLNPDGFRHAPGSQPGCLLFVKLRQYAGREHVVIDTRTEEWRAGSLAGVEEKRLYDSGDGETTRLERWAAGAAPGVQVRAGGVEILVLEGALEDGADRYEPQSWLRLPDGARHQLRSPDGCELYVKSGAVVRLQTQPLES